MPQVFRRKDFVFLVFPKLRLVKFSIDSFKWFNKFYRQPAKEDNKGKMRLPLKIGIGCAVALLIVVLFGFVAFPKMIKGKIKKMVTLDKSSEIRKFFVNVPFGLDFNVYMFNVTNPMEVQEGKLPIVREVGPFCYKEWKEKVDVDDDDANDFMFYKSKDTFIKDTGPGCYSGEEVITIPHPLILGMVNVLVRTKPAMLNLASKAINSIYRNPPSIFLTAKVNDILFDGVIINCGVTDFAGKAVCTQLRTEATDLRHVNDQDLAFALMAPKNGTPGKVFKVFRGVKVSHDVGRVLEYDGKKEMETWPTKECNQYKGTDGTIFPPLLTKEEGLAAYAPDLCRSLVSVYDSDRKYDGIPVRVYTATLGDMSKNADEKCYCPTPDTCLKKGLMDLHKCIGVPIYASLPHFYESDESYVKGVIGLTPNRKDHGIEILFEAFTGSPVAARKRLMFSMPIEPNAKVKQFNNLPTTIIPMFWVEEGVALNNTFTKPLKDFFKIIKIVKVGKWVILVACIAGMIGAAYLHFTQSATVNITPVRKVRPEDSASTKGISTVNHQDNFGGHVNHAMSDNEIDKY